MSDSESSITRPSKKRQEKSTYVCIHRQMHEGYLRGDANAQAVFVYLICKAQRFEKESGGKLYRPGDVIASLNLISDVTGLSKKVIFRCINKLEKGGSISTRRDHRGTCITVCNYLQYQEEPKHHGHTEGYATGYTTGYAEGDNYKKERKKELKKEIIKVSGDPSPGALIFESYKLEFQKKYGREPLRNAAVNSMCKKIADMVGLEDGKKLVAYYLAHTKPFYVEKRYDLKFLINDLQALHGEMKDGKKPQQTTFGSNPYYNNQPPVVRPAYTYVPEQVDVYCETCKGKGVIPERLDPQGKPYTCSNCRSFVALDFKPNPTPETLERRRKKMQEFAKQRMSK